MGASVRQLLVPRIGRQAGAVNVELGNLFKREGTRRFYTRHSQHVRNPMILSTRNWLRRGRYIPMFVNPREISWSVPRRETVVKTAAGAVRNTWRNRYRRTYLDEYMLNITFQTGNILPSSAYPEFVTPNPDITQIVQALDTPRLPPGLSNFYEFLALIDQPMLLGTDENRHVIVMYSRAFPLIRFEGYFTADPITWTESATGVDGGNQIVWQAQFQVYRSFPRITNFGMLERVYSSWVQKQGAGLALPIEKARDQAGVSPFAGSIGGLGPGPGPARTLRTSPSAAPFAGSVTD